MRERKEDISYLVKHFVEKFRTCSGKQIVGVENDMKKIYNNHLSPGNVHELGNNVEFVFINYEKGKIGSAHQPEKIF